MSKWDERVESHGVGESLRQLTEALTSLDINEAQLVIDVERLRNVCDFFEKALEASDPQLLTQGMLDRAHGPINSMLSEVQAFKGEGSSAHLDNANALADQLLEVVGSWPGIARKEHADGLRKSVASFRKSAAQLLKGIEGETLGTSSRFQEAIQTIASSKVELDAAFGEAKSKLDELKSAIDAERSANDALDGELRGSFATAESERKQEFDRHIAHEQGVFGDAIDELKVTSAALEDDLKKKVSAVEAQLQGSGSALVENLHKLNSKAEQIVGVIGNTGMTGGYRQYANEQRRAALGWAAGVIIPLLGIVVMGIWLIAEAHGDGSLAVSQVVAKGFVSLPLAAVAGYSAKQSSRHRRHERHARKVELELASIDAYIAPLRLEEQQAIKKEIGDRIFGQPDGHDTDDDKVGVQKLSELLAEAIKSLGKK